MASRKKKKLPSPSRKTAVRRSEKKTTKANHKPRKQKRIPKAQRTAAQIAKQKALYLMKYTETGRNDIAVKFAGVPIAAAFFWRKEDPEFQEAYNEARDMVVEMLESHAIKRGTQGVRKPIYHRGMLVGFDRQYSDSLLQFMMKGLAPETYRERISVTGKGDGPVTHGLTKETANFIRAQVLGVKPKKEKDGE